MPEDIVPTAGPRAHRALQEGDHVQVLVRDFLTSDIEQASDYAYYAYLLFLDATPQSRDLRLSASAAYLCQVEGAERLGELGVEREESAVWYAPVTDDIWRATDGGHLDAEDLVNAYGKAVASMIASSIRRGAPDTIDDEATVVIAAYPVPIDRETAVAADLLSVIDLSGFTAQEVHDAVKMFQREIKAPVRMQTVEDSLRTADGEVVTVEVEMPVIDLPSVEAVRKDWFRRVLASVGELMLSIPGSPAVAAAEPGC